MNEAKREELNWVILGIFISLIFIGIGVLIGLNIKDTETIQDVCLSCNNIYGKGNDYTVNNIDVLIDKLQSDCGSTHITKKYGSDEWYVFKRINKDGWEKSEYVLISECLEVKDEKR